MDITGFEDHKRRSMLAYESQFVIPEKNRRIVDVMMSSVTYFGSRIALPRPNPSTRRSLWGLVVSGSSGVLSVPREVAQSSSRNK